MVLCGIKGLMKWTQQLDRKQLFILINNVRKFHSLISIYYWQKKYLQSFTFIPSKNGYSQTRSCIFVTGHMTESGTTSCK